MAICYDRLFHLMIDKKISNAQLKEKAGFSANIITRLKRNEYVSIESIERICRVMECGVDDILEFVQKKAKRKKYEFMLILDTLGQRRHYQTYQIEIMWNYNNENCGVYSEWLIKR